MGAVDQSKRSEALPAHIQSAIDVAVTKTSEATRACLVLVATFIQFASESKPEAFASGGDLDDAAAAKIVGTTKTTFKRANVEPDYFVGTRPRWKSAESVRAKFAARGYRATTPAPKLAIVKNDDVDVSGALAGAGLRVAAGKGGGK